MAPDLNGEHRQAKRPDVFTVIQHKNDYIHRERCGKIQVQVMRTKAI